MKDVQGDDSLNQSQIECSLIKGEDDHDSHYVWMKQEFVSERSWLWIVNAVVYVVVIAVYFSVEGSEMSLQMYLPLDMSLNLAKVIFYFSCQWMDQREIEKQEKTVEVLRAAIKLNVKNKMANFISRKSIF